MFFKKIPEGVLGSNCYIIGENSECVIIDPGVEPEIITKVISDEKLTVKAIIITHAHFDHILYIDELKRLVEANVYASYEESEALSDSMGNGSLLFGSGQVFQKADHILKDGDKLNIGGLTLQVIGTPGHTDGGISIKGDDFVVTGDTLFHMSVGRTDLGRGDTEQLMTSIKDKLYTLADDTVVYPGHGTNSTIGFEKKNNPFTWWFSNIIR